MDVTEVLVSIEVDDVIAAVVRDDEGQLWLSDSVERISGTGISDYRPHQQCLTDDRTMFGGRLAPGSVAVEVVDDAGERHRATAANGAWIAVLHQPIHGPVSPVCCRDANGAPVAPALPTTWARAPVLDAPEPCPACGDVAWDRATPTDDSRGTRGGPDGRNEPTPIVVCRTCGHEETIGSILRITRADDEDPVEVTRRFQAARLQLRDEQRAQLQTLDFPVYAVEGWAATMVGSGGSQGRTTRVRVAHGTTADQPGPALMVETARAEQYRQSEYALAQPELERWLHDVDQSNIPTGRTDAGFTVAWRTCERQRRKIANAATHTKMSIKLDGEPESFTVLQAGRDWVAVRHRPAQTITISANETDPTKIKLRSVTNPVDELLTEPDR